MPAELGGEIHYVSRNRARMQVLPQAQKSHVYGSGTFGAFWLCNPLCLSLAILVAIPPCETAAFEHAYINLTKCDPLAIGTTPAYSQSSKDHVLSFSSRPQGFEFLHAYVS